MSKDEEDLDDEDDILSEYDFRSGVRGLARRPVRRTIRMTIDEDVARHYSSSESVNDALRQLIAEGRVPAPHDDHAPLRITWDSVKAAENFKKHRVTFEEARQIFSDPLRATEDDEELSSVSRGVRDRSLKIKSS
jgi:hypothetical protein